MARRFWEQEEQDPPVEKSRVTHTSATLRVRSPEFGKFPSMTKQEFEKFVDLSAQIGKWADENFDKAMPVLGMAEEVGETAHCLLKRLQRIRGFDDFEFYMVQLRDAIGDVMIYAGHNHYLTAVTPDKEPSLAEKHLSRVFMHIAFMFLNPAMSRSFLRSFEEFSLSLGVNPWCAMEETWNKIVSKRNWRSNPVEGATTNAD